MRASSEPPVNKGPTSSNGLVGNPWYSEKAQMESILRASRPQGLPEQSPDPEREPLRDEGLHAGLCVGKGRGGQASLKPCFVTPPSKVSGSGRGGEEMGGCGKRTEGRVPNESNLMGKLGSRDDAGLSADDSLERALEIELVNQLREQNAKLLSELEMYRQLRSTPKSGDDSTQSWVEVPSMGDGRDGHGAVGRGCNTPKNGSQFGRGSRFTPNGTRIPDGTPPTDDVMEVPQPPSLPPVPPFPMLADDAATGMLDQYEVKNDGSRNRMGEKSWKPQGVKDAELTPGEARAFWLEREVISLKQSLEKMTNGNPFSTSEYWSKGFHPPTGPPMFSGFPEEPTDLGRPDPDAAERISRANPGEGPGHLPAGNGDLPHRARAGMHSNHEECSGHLRGGSGPQALQARALHGDPGVCPHDRAPQSSHGVCLDHRALQGNHSEYPGARASQSTHGVCHDHRALQGSHGEYPDVRASQSTHGVCHDSRAFLASSPHPVDRQRSCLDPRHDGGGGFGGGIGRSPIPSSWETGGGGNTKAELPDLPALASPLQFGDWIHLCGPVMRDLSPVASRWWDLTTRQAQVHYAEWKQATPLQRVQIQPNVPDELQDRCYGRTEQRGVHLLLKAVAADVQQVLVTDRQMTSTAILFRLYVRYQPGGPGEKSLILKELTQLQKSNTMAELSAALRSWRRHFGRAREVGAILPDGTLLLRALEPAVQHVAKENSQAAFRLAQSRSTLQVDEQPLPATIWDFSQCLLAEAETLVLLNSSATSLSESPPLKLKVMEANDTSSPTKPQPEGSSSGKGRGGSTSDVPCRWFKSDTGCRAGKQCKWSHSWEGISDKNARCWNCGSKEHRKQDCKVKGGGSKRPDEPKGSGGGSSAPTNVTNKTTGAATPGASTTSTTTPSPKINELTTSTAASPGELKTGNSGAEPAEMVKGLGDGGTGGDQAAKNEKTAELLHEATQLLKTLRIPPSTPQLKVMQIGGLDHTEANRVLIDSGATHGLRPARDHDEWLKSTRTTVQLANGSTEAFRLKPGTKILLGHPEEAATWIVPMGGLTDLDFTMTWSGNQCQLRDDEGRQIDVQVIHGCPMISLADGQMILQWLEAHQVHQQRKLAMVRTLMNDESQVDQSKLDLEMALTLKLRQHFPDLPDEVMMRVVPYLEMVKAESFQSRLPWNRHKRRRLNKAKHVVIHLFSGPDQTYWDRKCASETTEVLCVDTTCSTPANLLDKNVYAYLVALCASGRVRSILGGPPCRTLTALRYQGDDGPGVLRTDEYPYGLPSLSPADTELVLNDSTLMFRFWSLLIMAEEFRPDEMPVTQFFMEQPEDPARYRSQQDVEQHKYFSIFRTREWQQLASAFNLQQYHFDQFPMGHPKRKPTCLATNVTEMQQLDNVRGAPPNEAELTNQFRSLPMGQRFETSSSWSAWAPGLKDAIAMAVSQRVQWLERELHVQRPPALRTLSSAALVVEIALSA